MVVNNKEVDVKRFGVLLTALIVFLTFGVAAALADEYAGPKLWYNGDSAQGSYSQSWYENDFAKPSGGYLTWSGFKRGTDYGLQGVSNTNEVTVYTWDAPTTSKAGHCIYQATNGASYGGCIENT